MDATRSNDPVAEYQRLKKEQADLAERIKCKLENQLEQAGATLGVLREMGIDPLKEERIRSRLGPFLATDSKKSRPAGGSDGQGRVKRKDLKAAILEALRTERSHAELKASSELTRLYADIGKKVPNQFTRLESLEKENLIIRTGAGRAAKYKTK